MRGTACRGASAACPAARPCAEEANDSPASNAQGWDRRFQSRSHRESSAGGPGQAVPPSLSFPSWDEGGAGVRVCATPPTDWGQTHAGTLGAAFPTPTSEARRLGCLSATEAVTAGGQREGRPTQGSVAQWEARGRRSASWPGNKERWQCTGGSPSRTHRAKATAAAGARHERRPEPHGVFSGFSLNAPNRPGAQLEASEGAPGSNPALLSRRQEAAAAPSALPSGRGKSRKQARAQRGRIGGQRWHRQRWVRPHFPTMLRGTLGHVCSSSGQGEEAIAKCLLGHSPSLPPKKKGCQGEHDGGRIPPSFSSHMQAEAGVGARNRQPCHQHILQERRASPASRPAAAVSQKRSSLAHAHTPCPAPPCESQQPTGFHAGKPIGGAQHSTLDGHWPVGKMRGAEAHGKAHPPGTRAAQALPRQARAGLLLPPPPRQAPGTGPGRASTSARLSDRPGWQPGGSFAGRRCCCAFWGVEVLLPPPSCGAQEPTAAGRGRAPPTEGWGFSRQGHSSQSLRSTFPGRPLRKAG